MEWIDSILGVIFYTVVVFTAGALAGKPMYTWVSSKMPWTK